MVLDLLLHVSILNVELSSRISRVLDLPLTSTILVVLFSIECKLKRSESLFILRLLWRVSVCVPSVESTFNANGCSPRYWCWLGWFKWPSISISIFVTTHSTKSVCIKISWCWEGRSPPWRSALLFPFPDVLR